MTLLRNEEDLLYSYIMWLVRKSLMVFSPSSWEEVGGVGWGEGGGGNRVTVITNHSSSKFFLVLLR